jgi:biopolymer transport protein ExbB/TolQ
MTLIDQLVKVALLGATWVLYLMFLLSIAAVAAMVERWVFFRRNGRGGAALDLALRRAIEQDDEAAIERALASGSSVEANVLRQGFEFRRGGPSAFGDGIDSALLGERQRLDRGSTLLGTIGNNAPFVGLFGTVLGIIEAFSYLSAGDQAAMGNVMSGIAEALVATAVGIFVAIPAVVAYNIVQKKSGEIETRAQTLAKLLSAWLHTRARAATSEDSTPRAKLAAAGGG